MDRPTTLIKASLRLVCTGLFAVSAAVAQSPSEDRVSEQLRQRMETGSLVVQGANIGVEDPLPEFYTRRDFRRVWTRAEQVQELLRLLATSGDHGLNPEDYFLSKLQDQVKNTRRDGSRPVTDPAVAGTGIEDQAIPDEASRLAELDILLTEALIRYGYHRRFGKVTPTTVEPNWNFKRAFAPGVDPVGLLEEAVHAKSLADFVEERIPHGPWYKRLQAALKHYRSIAASGGWAAVPTGRALKPGGADPRVAALRERLGITGDLRARGAGSGNLYDDELERAVRRFQDRHALSVDGIVGRQTLAALNVPLQARIDQLRLSLERARWVLESVVPRYVAVNTAGFRAAMVREGNVVWTARVVVGRAYRQTPVFRGEMQYLVLNPTWTVPPGILRNDTLPKVKEDPDYLRRENFRVIDRNGRRVDPSSVNWRAYGGSVPYTLRQDPGADNALGRIKFVFPNPHAVYLHDTPARNLFEQPERTFSSGCIRVEDPFRLAELLLDDPKWTRQALQRAVDAGNTQVVRLGEPVPVFILYFTATVDPDGTLRFYKDVYERDARLLAALNGEVRIDLPPLPIPLESNFRAASTMSLHAVAGTDAAPRRRGASTRVAQ